MKIVTWILFAALNMASVVNNHLPFYTKCTGQSIRAPSGKLCLRGGNGDTTSIADNCRQAEKLTEEAWSLYNDGEVTEAERTLQAALRLDPQSIDICSKLAMIYEFDEQDLGKAEEIYLRTMSIKPNDSAYVYDYASFLQDGLIEQRA